MTIFVLAGYYLPGYKAGGPIRSIENLVAALGGEFIFRIVTRDRDLGDAVAFPTSDSKQWVRIGQAEVLYLPAGWRGWAGMYALLRSLDRDAGLYVNSFFAPRYSILAVLMRWLKLSRPGYLVLAPRGEFSLGALRLKRWRKAFYSLISRRLGLHRNVIWQASSAFEAADIQRQFPGVREVAIAPVLAGMNAADAARSPAPSLKTRRRKPAGELRAVFLSRVAPTKNLAGAIAMLAGLSGDVRLDIYGPAEDREYLEICQNTSAALPANIQIRYHGQIEHARVGLVFADHDLLLFPTLGENYGHVISEALMAGCPALISDQTPWRNLEQAGVGWDIPLIENERFRAVLQQCVDGDAEWHAALSARASSYGARHAWDPERIDANRRLFQIAAESRSLSFCGPYHPTDKKLSGPCSKDERY